MRIIKSLYKISENYWVDIDLNTFVVSKFLKANNEKRIYKWEDNDVIGEEINKIFHLGLETNRLYWPIVSGKSLTIVDKKNSFTFFRKKGREDLKRESDLISNKFRLILKHDFISNIFFNASSISEILSQLCKYIFSEHFSLWLYNHKTKYYTKICASFEAPVEIKRNDNLSSQIKAFKRGDYYISEEFIREKYSGNGLEGMKTVNRIFVQLQLLNDLKEETFLIANFFSSLDDFILRKKTVEIIQETVNLKLSRDWLPDIEAKNSIAKELSQNYELGKFAEHINYTLDVVNTRLGWEASSIFLVDSSRSYLELKALRDNRTDFAKKSLGNVRYDLKGTSMTAQVFHNSLVYSYDIFNDKLNSHTFDENTKSKPRNWLGLPIKTELTESIGVLRVKNKFDTKTGRLRPFNDIDISILESIASSLAHIFNIELMYERFSENKDKEISKQRELNDQLMDFMRTYRHEIKSPLTVITLASLRIRMRLIEDGLIPKDKTPKRLQELFDDLNSVGDRLAYVASALSFDATELVKKVESVFPFTGIIAPVTAFSKLYAEKRGKTLSIDEPSLKILQKVQADPFAGSMAFHIILDNAIKYARTGTEIRIFGLNTSGHSVIIVENESLVNIFDFETEKIFEKFYQGQDVRAQTIEGNGIGLALGRDIMDNLGGKIILARLKNPTRFELHFKYS